MNLAMAHPSHPAKNHKVKCSKGIVGRIADGLGASWASRALTPASWSPGNSDHTTRSIRSHTHTRGPCDRSG